MMKPERCLCGKMMDQLSQISPSNQAGLFIEAVQSYGVHQEPGNLVGIQSYMTAVYFATAVQFQRRRLS